jgi:hypothetical protein
MNTNLEPEDWLTDLDAGTTNAALTHPRVSDFAERVTERVTELRKEHQLVSSLVDYARALNGHVEIRVTVADHTYIEQLA